MAVRIVALLIPLAIILPQLQASRPTTTQAQAAPQQVDVVPEWSYETRRGADAALTRVVLDAPAHEAMRLLDNEAPMAAPAAGPHKAPAPHVAAKLARSAHAVKGPTTIAASQRPVMRHAKSLALLSACEPLAHCAPVEDAKVTPVNRPAL